MSTGNAEAEVRHLEEKRLQALASHDVEAVGELLDDELVHVHATGRVETRDEFLEHLRVQPRLSERRSLQVRIYGDDVAVLTGEVVNTLIRPGKTLPESVAMFVTQVARKKEGLWRFVSFHACRAG